MGILQPPECDPRKWGPSPQAQPWTKQTVDDYEVN